MEKGGIKEIGAMKDELDEIFVDKNESVDKKIVVDILKPLVTIDQEGVLSFTEGYESLDETKKALVYLVCKKAITLRGINGFIESSGPTEISKGAHTSVKNVENALYIYHKNLVKKEGKGYVIPNHNLKKVKE